MYAIAMIPIPVFAGAWLLQPSPIKSHHIVGIPDMFAERFGEDRPTVLRVRTISLARQQLAEAVNVEPPVPAPRPRPEERVVERTYHKPARSTDICARHNMRKVTIGKRWRCRR